MAENAISRRQALAAAAAVTGAAAMPARAAAGGRPNILWVVSEDNNPFIGAYGDRLAWTPHIDALAAKGLLYRHVYSNAPVCAPSRFGILTGVYPESCAPANHMRAEGKAAGLLATYPELMRRAGYWCTNNAKTDYNSDYDPAKLWDGQGKEAHWRSRPDTRPFMAVFNYETTHESQLFRPTPGRVTADQVRVPRYLPDTPEVRGNYASYYNLIEKMDAQIGARLAELEADGLADNTIVFYYSDNGGVMPRSKRYCYDEGFRVAMVVHVPPKWRHLAPAAPGSVIESPVSFIDLAPTVLSLAGAAAPAQMAGKPFLGTRMAPPQRYAFGMRNRMDERIDFVRSVTDGRWRYIRNYMPHRPWGVNGAFEWLMKSYQSWEANHLAGTLTPEQDRFFGAKPFEELYDLSVDPDQVVNLATSHATERVRLSQALDHHMLAINDNGFIPEGVSGEGWAASRDARRYPLAQLMTLGAAVAAKRADASMLRAALADSNSIVRYWGTMGMLITGATASGELAHALTDPEPQVRVVAAEALALAGNPAAVPALGTLASPPHPWQVRLAALNALTALGERARPVLPAIDAAAAEDQEYLRSAGRYLSAVLNGTYRPGYPVLQIEHMMQMIREGKMKV